MFYVIISMKLQSCNGSDFSGAFFNNFIILEIVYINVDDWLLLSLKFVELSLNPLPFTVYIINIKFLIFTLKNSSLRVSMKILCILQIPSQTLELKFSSQERAQFALLRIVIDQVLTYIAGL